MAICKDFARIEPEKVFVLVEKTTLTGKTISISIGITILQIELACY